MGHPGRGPYGTRYLPHSIPVRDPTTERDIRKTTTPEPLPDYPLDPVKIETRYHKSLGFVETSIALH